MNHDHKARYDMTTAVTKANGESLESLNQLLQTLLTDSVDLKAAKTKKKQQLIGEAMKEKINQFYAQHGTSLGPELMGTIERVSCVPVTNVHKSLGAACKHNRTDNMAETEWRWEDTALACGKEFEAKLGRIPVLNQKLFTFLIGEFTKTRGELGEKPTRSERTMSVSLKPFMELAGLVPSEADGKTEEQRKTAIKNGLAAIRSALRSVFSISATINYKKSGKKRALYVHLFDRIEHDAEPDYTIQGTMVTFTLSPEAAYFFTLKHNQKHFHNCLYSISEERSSALPGTAWAIGIAMDEHWYMYSNWPDPDPRRAGHSRKDTHNRLKFSTLWARSPLPERKQAGKNPKRYVFDPMFAAMDQLEDIGFLDEYYIERRTANGSYERLDPEYYYNSFTFADMETCDVVFNLHDPVDISESINEWYKTTNKRIKRQKKEG